MEQEPQPPGAAPARLFMGALALLVLLQAAVVARLAPPSVVAASAPDDAFSAERALARVERVLGDQAPHPVGTLANDRVRERLLAELRDLGLEPEVREAWAWSRHHRAALTRNVLARLPGAGPGPAVLLLCHYDSVPAGPGASDDGMGMGSLLEVARALRAGPPLPRPVLLLFTDAEEAGLLGARAFVRDDPARHEVGVVVNVESRGTSGPSVMFETSRGNAWLVRALAASLPRPVCSSLFPTIYEVLPNDTDLTAFLSEGEVTYPAVNFGNVVDVDHYHTPRDDLAHLSRETLQHHGDNALHLTRALAGLPLDALRGSQERLVFFDVLGVFVVRWPEPWTLPLALLAVGLVAAVVTLEVRGGRCRPATIGLGLLAWALALVAAVVAGVVLSAGLVALTSSASPWAASPVVAQVGAWAIALTSVGTAGAWLVPRAGAGGAWAGVWLPWSLAAVALAATLPGAAFLFVVPAGVAGATGLLAALRPGVAGLRALALLAPLVAAALLWLPVVRGLDWAVGLMQKTPVVVAAALLAGALLPLLPGAARERLALPAASAGVGLLALACVLVAPAHDAERPQRLNLVYEEHAGAGTATWSVDARYGAVPPALIEAGELIPAPGASARWGPGARLEARAHPLGLAPVEVTIVDGPSSATDEVRRVRVRLRSPRGAWAVSVQLATPARAVSVGGLRREPREGLTSFDLLGLPPEGVEVELELPPSPVELTVKEISLGLPPSGAPLVAARPAWCVPSHLGDLTVVVSRQRL